MDNQPSAKNTNTYATLLALLVLLAVAVPSIGLKCYQCGQYTDGVGSITPCINHTAELHLKECPESAKFCVKYVSEGSIVRDCIVQCSEKEVWGTKQYCCDNPGCNSSRTNSITMGVLLCSAAILTLRQIIF